MKALAVILACLCVSAPVYADALVAKGKKATLTVDYVYEAVGKKQDRNDLREWRVSRVAKLSAELTAEAAMALPAMHKPDAAKMADMERMQERGASVQQKMAPMMADIEKFMAKCGDDEACMEREIQNYGMSTQMTPEVKSAQQDLKAMSMPGASRYQLWSASAQTGTYAIDEQFKDVLADPGCMPTLRCTRNETRKGAGELPLPPGTKNDPKAATGFALIEVDAAKNTMMMRLPTPLMPLSYTKTVTTNSSDEKGGTTQGLASFPGEVKPIAVALTGDVKSQSGTQSIKMNGAGGESGTLTVTWRFVTK